MARADVHIMDLEGDARIQGFPALGPFDADLLDHDAARIGRPAALELQVDHARLDHCRCHAERHLPCAADHLAELARPPFLLAGHAHDEGVVHQGMELAPQCILR